jgi:hypothetical protein
MKMHKPDDNQHYQEAALEAPPELVSALKRLPQEPVFVPPTVDESVLRAARRHLERPQTGRVSWFRIMPWAAAAAAMVLLGTLPRLSRQPAPKPGPGSVFAQRDLNHDGRVDILDAFALATQLKQGGARDLRLDVNGDGVVDDRDVATIAARAVKLEPGGRS